MALDVFISHASEDTEVADAMCFLLEQSGLRCWMAPRDVTIGSTYGKSIVRAISAVKVLVVVLSSNANTSVHVAKEVERAVSKGVSVIPFRIENVLPSGDLEYFVSAEHWLDALSPPLEAHLHRLGDAIRSLLVLHKTAPDGSRAAIRDAAAARMFDEVAPDAWRLRKTYWLTRWLQTLLAEREGDS